MRGFACVAGAALLLGGCASPYQYTVTRAAAANPLAGQHRVAVAPIAYAPAFTVSDKPEAAYLADRTDDERAAWSGDKQALELEFRKALELAAERGGVSTTASDAPFTLHPTVSALHPGFAGPAAMTVTLTDASGATLDEVRLEPQVTSQSIGQRSRMRDAGFFLGETAARYLVARVAAK